MDCFVIPDEFDASAGGEGGSWQLRAPMPTSRSAGGAAELDGCECTSNPPRVACVASPVSERLLACCAFKGLYVAGGWPPHGSDFARYNPTSDEWEVLPDM